MKASDNILVGESIYITGHKKPDMDAIVAPHAYQIYRHSQGDFNYLAVRCDEANEVTQWAYNRWGFELPPYVSDFADRKIVLVDHTDPEQRPSGWEKGEIIEVVDHHKIKLETSAPPKITVMPYGSTSTIIALKMVRGGVKIDKSIAGLMLSAIIDDTLALRSPITTFVDKQMAGVLASEAGIVSLSDYAREQFAQKDHWHKMSAQQVCELDSKVFEMGTRKVRITQVETMDNRKLESKYNSYFNYMKGARTGENLDVYLVLITDLIRNECVMLVSADPQNVTELEEVFDTKLENGMYFRLPGVVSRKLQVVPPLDNHWKIVG